MTFRDEAPKYWAHGLSVLPTEPGTKQPAKSIKGWQGYLAAPPRPDTQAEWLARYGDYGIAVMLGGEVCPGQVLIGLDADDDRLVAVVRAAIGDPMVGKRGKKGATFFVLVPKLPKLKSTTLKGAAGLGNIDVLAGGRISVMEPTVHPETGRPYEVVGVRLVDTPFEALPRIDGETLKLLRLVLAAEQTVNLLAGKPSHNDGLELTGKLVAAGISDESILNLFPALLPPDYSGNSLEELPEWIRSAHEKGFDQPDGGGKSDGLTALLVTLAHTGGAELFTDGDGNAYCSVPLDDGRTNHRVGSTALKQWLRHQAHVVLQKPVSTGPLNEAIATLEAIAIYEGPKHRVYSRVAGEPSSIEIDLGRSDGRVVQIKSGTWAISQSTQYRFVRGSGYGELPLPVVGGSLSDLQSLLRLEDDNFRLLLAFLINALKPTGPYFALLVEGEQGSGKSFFCQLVKRLIDPNGAERLRMPDNERDLMIHAKEYWLLNYDNASGMKPEMSDALCSLATGGGVAVRRLYTDGELHVMAYARPFVINGISGYANRPDLLERGIPVRLPPMASDTRSTEEELTSRLGEILPGVLGALYDAVALAIQGYPATEAPRQLRMADAGRWIAAAEPAFGLPAGAVIAAIVDAQDRLFVERANDDALIIRLRELVASREFAGHVGELFALLDVANHQGLPRSPSRLSTLLERMRPSMIRAGLEVTFGRDNRGRTLRIRDENSKNLANF